MDEEDRDAVSDHRWTGAITVLLGLAGIGLFVLHPGGDSVGTSGIAAGVFLICCGVFVYLDPDIGTLGEMDTWADGVFWIVVGAIVVGLVHVFEPNHWPTKWNGYGIGGSVVLIGSCQFITSRFR